MLVQHIEHVPIAINKMFSVAVSVMANCICTTIAYVHYNKTKCIAAKYICKMNLNMTCIYTEYQFSQLTSGGFRGRARHPQCINCQVYGAMIELSALPLSQEGRRAKIDGTATPTHI